MDQNITDVEAQMSRVQIEIDRLVAVCNYEGENIKAEGLDEEFKKRMYVNLIQRLSDMAKDIKYLLKPVVDLGVIRHNASGRYELPSGFYFTSGSSCEILCDPYNDGEKAWWFTAIEHSGQDYYATVLGKNVSIDGYTVRIRH